MAGPYDYSINIPQPPAQNFLQSLMGIRQLQQMEEQSAIQQQQAAIQQQNAAFQQQMQPLEMEKARAAIAAQQSALAGSEQSRRQNEILFRQGQENRVREMEQQAVAQAQQRELVGKFTSLPPNAPMSEIVPIANQLLLLPGGDKVAKQAMDNFDALQQEFQKASKTALVTATTQLQAGDVEGAKKTYSTFEQAVRNSGGTNPQLVQLADGIKAQKMLLDLPNDQGVNSAKLAAVQMLSIVDPKAADTILQGEKVVVPAKEKQVDEEKRALDLEKERLQIRELEQKLDQVKPEKPLPSSLLRANAEINKSVDSANEMADKLEQASEAIRGLPSRGFLSEKYLQLKQIFRGVENPEITIRNNAAQLAGLGMLGAEKTAMGGAIRSNVQFQYATSKLPDAYQSPQALADKLAAQAQVQRKISKLMAIDAEWNSAFRGSQKAKTDEEILGYNVPAGTSRTQFKEMVAKELFPSQTTKPSPTAPTSNLGRPVSTGTLPVAPASGTPSDVDAILKQFGVR